MPSQLVKLCLGVRGFSIAPGKILPWNVVGMQIDGRVVARLPKE